MNKNVKNTLSYKLVLRFYKEANEASSLPYKINLDINSHKVLHNTSFAENDVYRIYNNILAPFAKEYLVKHKLLELILYNISEQRHIRKNFTFEDAVDMLSINSKYIEQFISGIFSWRSTENGFTYWEDAHYGYVNYMQSLFSKKFQY